MIISLLIATVVLVAVFTKICLPSPTSHAIPSPSSHGFYHIHNKQVYFIENGQKQSLVADAHARTFQVLSQGYGQSLDESAYARDFLCVYYNGKCIPGADPVHFQVLGKDLGRDDRNVFKAHALLSADARNFKCLGDRLCKDSHRVFFDDRVISEDASHFRFVGKWRATCIYKDRTKVFVNGKGYRVADINTFDYTGNGIFSDRHQAYRFDGHEFQPIFVQTNFRSTDSLQAAIG